MPHVDATTPYAWPYDAAVDPATLALVIAGAQVAWPGACPPGTPVHEAIARVAAAVRSAGGTVVLLRHSAPRPAGPSDLPPMPSDAAWALALDPQPDDLVVDAWGTDGFHGSPLDDALRARGVTHLVMTGFGAEVAVDSTLRAANDRGYECLTLADAVAPFDPDTGARALSSITMSGGIFGAVGTTAALLACLEELT